MTIYQIHDKIDAFFGMTSTLEPAPLDPKFVAEYMRPGDEHWLLVYRTPTGKVIATIGVVKNNSNKKRYYLSGGDYPYQTAKQIRDHIMDKQ